MYQTWLALLSVRPSPLHPNRSCRCGAVARGFGRNLSYLIPPLSQAGPQIALAIAVIAGLAALNYRGIKPGALVSDFFSGAKLIPIALFIAAGLFFVDWGRLAAPAFSPLPSMIRVDAIGRMDVIYDEVSEALGEDPGYFDQSEFEEDMSTHYGRMIHTDDRTIMVANPEDAAEYLGFDLTAK